MHSTRAKPRPLGTVRQSLTGLDKVPHLPRLSNSADLMLGGIQGNALSVPSTGLKESPSTIMSYDRSEERRKSSSKSNQSDSRSNRSPDLSKKELREALIREKDLKSEVNDLLKIIEELRGEIVIKDECILQLQNELILQERDFKSQLSLELEHHQETTNKLQTSNEQVEQLRKEIKTLKLENDNKLMRLHNEFEDKLSSTIREKDKEIQIQDEKLNKLKQHMADALQGNSWERQQQLEELTKELAKIQDEADTLRSKIKALTKAKHVSCNHCEESDNKLRKALHAIKEKDQAIKGLQTLAVKFETQLSQQDQLLKMWAEEKGHKIELPK